MGLYSSSAQKGKDKHIMVINRTENENEVTVIQSCEAYCMYRRCHTLTDRKLMWINKYVKV